MSRPTDPARILAKQGVNERADRLGWALSYQTAPLITLALVLIRAELEDGAAYTGSGDTSAPRVSGGGRTVWVEADEHGEGEHVPVTSVEAAVLRGAQIRDQREQIRDRLDGLIIAHRSLDDLLRRIVPTDMRRRMPDLCDGKAKGYEGHMDAWTPHSRDHRNGWHNPGCREIAGPTGLCDACLKRMNRWRREHGYGNIGVEAAA